MNRIAASGVGIALVAAITLKADDRADESRFSFGTGFTIVQPIGGDQKSGLGLGPVFTAEMKLTDRQSLLGRLEYVQFRGVDIGLGTREYWQRLSSLRLETDWVFSFSPDGRGFYVLGGLGVENNDWRSFQLDPSVDLHSSRHNKFDPVLVLGGGYAFTRWLAVEYKRDVDLRTGRLLPGGSWGIHHPKYGRR